MWSRFLEALRCPACGNSLQLHKLESRRADLSRDSIELGLRRGVRLDGDGAEYIESGLLLCAGCKLCYPIVHGVPLMLRYRTKLHDEFDSRWQRASLAEGFRYPDETPEPGEEFVRESFSTEWIEYDYDGVIWESSYDVHAERIAREIGPAIDGNLRWHLEVGCGLGIAASVVQQRSGCDVVGLDLSLAAIKAARHFRDNPFMHFVQASAFAIPLATDWFDTIYSRGVLHHTYSTERAFRRVARHCRPGGTFYVWLYGPGSIRSSPMRLGLYGLEAATRPLVARRPNSPLAGAFLRTMAVCYVAFNRIRRATNRDVQPLDFARGLHAARDRFTPRYAHRHAPAEVLRWFQDVGYESATVLDWRDMPPSEQDDFRRNVGIRAVRSR